MTFDMTDMLATWMYTFKNELGPLTMRLEGMPSLEDTNQDDVFRIGQHGAERLKPALDDEAQEQPPHSAPLLIHCGENTVPGETGTALGLRFSRMIAELHENQGRTGMPRP